MLCFVVDNAGTLFSVSMVSLVASLALFFYGVVNPTRLETYIYEKLGDRKDWLDIAGKIFFAPVAISMLCMIASLFIMQNLSC